MFITLFCKIYYLLSAMCCAFFCVWGYFFVYTVALYMSVHVLLYISFLFLLIWKKTCTSVKKSCLAWCNFCPFILTSLFGHNVYVSTICIPAAIASRGTVWREIINHYHQFTNFRQQSLPDTEYICILYFSPSLTTCSFEHIGENSTEHWSVPLKTDFDVMYAMKIFHWSPWCSAPKKYEWDRLACQTWLSLYSLRLLSR